MKRIYTLIITFLLCSPMFAQIGVINSPPLIPDSLAQRLVGYGLEISNAQLLCADGGSGYFFGAGAAGFGMGSGIVLTSGSTTVAFSPNTSGSASAGGGPGFAPLEEFPNAYNGTFNACVLEFDFVPQGDTIKFNYVFGSEEYPEWVGSQFNDIFAFLIEGEPEYPSTMPVIQRNIAIIPDSPDPGIHVAINFLNQNQYSQHYITNQGIPSSNAIQYDGLTTLLTAKAKVTPCNSYHLTLAVADVSDAIYDTGVFLEEGSFVSNTFFVEDAVSNISETEDLDFVVENCGEGTVTFQTDFPTPEGYDLPLVTNFNPSSPDVCVLGGTATLFLDYTLSAGSVIIDPNATEGSLDIFPVVDGEAEEDEFITFAFYSSCDPVPYQVDTFWIYDEINAVTNDDIDICQAGTEVQLNGWESNGINLEQDRFFIRWEPATGLSCTDCLDPIATVNATTTYTFIIGYDETICSDQSSVTITVDPDAANFDAVPDFSICANQLAQLSATGGIEYTWQTPDGGDPSNLSCTDCPDPTFTPPNSDGATYAYQVIVSSGPGCSETFPVEVTVDLADLSVEQPAAICPGDMTTLSVSGEGSNFVWTRGNGLPAGVGASIDVNPDVTTSYTVVATDVTCPNPQTITLVVDQVDAAFNPVQPVCAGEVTNLVGQGGQQYQWLDLDGNVLSTNQSYTPTIEENTTFQLVAQTNNCFDTISVLAPIEPVREIQFITENPVICGDITSIDLAVESIPGVTFTWSPAGAFTVSPDAPDGSIVTATPPSDGFTYTVTAVTDLGCTPPAEISVAVGTELEITVDAPEVLCIDLTSPEPITINAFGGATYTWEPFGPVIPVTAGAGQAILFPNPDNNEVEIIVTGEDEEGNCMGETSFMVQVFQEPEMSITPPVICEGETGEMSVSIVGGSGDFTYEWFPPIGLSSPNAGNTDVTIDESTTYTLFATDNIAGCELQQEITIDVSPTPDVSLVPAVAACNGEEVTISVEGGEGFEMNWTDTNGNPVATGTDLVVSPATTTTYNLTVGTDCPVELQTTVEIIEVEISASASAAQICDGEEVALTAEGTGIVTYEWTQANGLSGTNGPNQTATPTGTTTYIVTGYDAGGNCTATAEVTVEVATIQLQLPPDPFTCGVDDPAELNIDGGPGATYSWDPPTGLSATNLGSVTANPATTTTYNVQVISAEGCEENVVVTVNVFPPIEVNIEPALVSLCPGETATYTLSGAETYNFEEVNGGAFQILSNVNGVVEILANSNASFNITGISENGCRAETTAELVINEPATTISPSIGICPGEETTLSADGGAGATYQWNNAATLDDPNSPNPTASPTETTQYEVLITDNNGCTTTEQVTVAINQPAQAQLTVTPDDVCPGTAITLFAGNSPNSTYTYYDGEGNPLPQNAQGQAIVIPTENTTYSVVVETQDGCMDEAVASVTFNEDPVLEAQDGVACPDGSTTMTVSGAGVGATYEWNPSNIVTCNNPECSAVTVTPTGPVNFTITGTTSAGCSAQTQAAVSIEDALSITVSPANPSLCIGETITLSAGGATDFTWEGPGLSTTTGGSVEVDINAAGTYDYTLIGTANDCSGSTTFSVVINDLPTIEATPAPTLCEGDTFTLEATGGVDYEWTLGGNPVNNLNVTPATTTTYDVIGTDANGCSNISQVTVEVEEPIQLSVTTDDDEICFGSQTSIMATGAVSFEWSTTDVTGDGELLTVSPTETTTYTVVATSANGCQTTGEITIDVLEPFVNLAPADNFCIGESGIVQVADGTGNYTWEGEGITGSGTSISVAPTAPGPYTYTVTTDINGCIATASVQVEVFAEPELNLPTDLQICQDGQTDITVEGANTYEWIDPNGSLNTATGETVTASPTVETTYTVIGTSINGCQTTAEITVAVGEELILAAEDRDICEGSTDGVSLLVSGGNSYEWSVVSGDEGSLNTNVGDAIIVNPNETTVYEIIGTDDEGCSGETTVTVVVNELPQASAGEPGLICPGDSFELAATGGVQFIWDDPTGTLNNPNIANPVASPTEPTTYTVTVLNENGCSSTSEVFVDLEPAASVVVPTTGETCSNSLFEILGAETEHTSTVTWTSSGTGTFLDPNNVSTSYQPGEEDAGTFVTLTLSADGCGTPSESFQIEVKQSTAELNVPTPLAVCPGEEIPLEGQNIGTGNLSNISWTGGTGSFSLGTSLTPTYRPGENEIGEVTLILSAEDECGTVSTPVPVMINPLVNVDAGDDKEITEGDEATLQGSGATLYNWTVSEDSNIETAGIRSDTNESSLVVSPTETTTYLLSSGDLCSDIDEVTVTVLAEGQIAMPNSFSPNGDGFNDQIFPVGFNFELVGYRIYSRWGEEVFNTTTPDVGWDGMFKGEPAEIGAYAYVIEYKLGSATTTEVLAGSITLIR